jgi:hypothetical protein
MLEEWVYDCGPNKNPGVLRPHNLGPRILVLFLYFKILYNINKEVFFISFNVKFTCHLILKWYLIHGHVITSNMKGTKSSNVIKTELLRTKFNESKVRELNW